MRDARAAAGARPLYAMSLDEARGEDLRAIREGGGTPEPVASVVDDRIPGPGGDLPIRIYRPDADGTLPVLAYFFGGGWTLGTIDTSDGVCRALTNAAGCVTVAVGYRLAPEHKFPAAVDDCYAGTAWMAAHAAELGVDARRLAVGGDSAGGNLAAAVTLKAKAIGGPALLHQLLVYPNTDHASDTASLRENTDEALFNAKSVDWYWRHYLRAAEDGGHPLASPLRAADLTGLPPATLITAEYDPLRDQAEAYGDRLRAAGVPVEVSRYAGMAHGFFTMSGVLPAAGHAVRYAATRLRSAFQEALVA
ncbi:MAG TPA: alpha/beta hydrolase [Pseudonocardiaceae bacterium]|jgi:acetyl esterase|nr:alpha/beta hydrolase [Pseudonocardiaceae bacterium]